MLSLVVCLLSTDCIILTPQEYHMEILLFYEPLPLFNSAYFQKNVEIHLHG